MQIKRTVSIKDSLPSNGTMKPTSTPNGPLDFIEKYTAVSGDQTTMVKWFENLTLNTDDCQLMLIHFRKWNKDDKRGEGWDLWKKTLDVKEQAYTLAKQSEKTLVGKFNERAFVRVMCSKYTEYLSDLISKDRKLYASKCLVYVRGRGFIASELLLQKEEILKFQKNTVTLDTIKYRRCISLLELTRGSDEKNSQVDMLEVAAWCDNFMETFDFDSFADSEGLEESAEVNYIDVVKYHQICWKSLWEPVVKGGNQPQSGTLESIEQKKKAMKNKPQPVNPPQNQNVISGNNNNNKKKVVKKSN